MFVIPVSSMYTYFPVQLSYLYLYQLYTMQKHAVNSKFYLLVSSTFLQMLSTTILLYLCSNCALQLLKKSDQKIKNILLCRKARNTRMDDVDDILKTINFFME